MGHLRDPQSGGVGRHQDHPVLVGDHRREEAVDFIQAEDHRQVSLAPGAADVPDDLAALEHPAVHVAQGRQRLVVGAPGHLLLFHEMDQVLPHLFLPE